MPNWVFNTLTIQGPKEQVDSIRKQLNEPFQRDHENWNMETQQMETRTYLFPNPVFSFWNIVKPTNMEAYNGPQPQVDLSKDIAFDSDHWYDWNVRNWGTKWDVAVSHDDEYPDTEELEYMSSGEDNWVVYKFNTAWSPPAPAMEKLSALVPNCVVTLSYEEETGWGGEAEFVNGKLTAESDYESKCRDCDAEDCMEYCENDCGEICSECNYMGEADLECVAECDTHKVYLDDDHVPDYRKVKV